MALEALEAHLQKTLPTTARVGARVRGTLKLQGHEVEVVLRIDRNGRRVFNHHCDGTRMPRPTLLHLLCPETACPHASEVQAQWRRFVSGPERPAPARRRSAVQVRPLIEEVVVDAAGHHCLARPASFECHTPCPMRAHPPQVLRKPGWDLFENGQWIAGGLRSATATGSVLPRFGTPDDARAWLVEQQARAQALIDRWR